MGNYIDPSDIDNWPSGYDTADKVAKINEIEQFVEKTIGAVFYEQTFDLSMNGNNKNRIFPPLHNDIITVRHVYISGTELEPSWYKWDESSIYLNLDASMDELTDGEFEDWAGADALSFWLKTEAGTSTINRDSTDVYEGNYSCRFDIDVLNSDVFIYQSFTMLPSRDYTLSITRMMSAAGMTGQIMIRDSGSNVWLGSNGSWYDSAQWIEIANALTFTTFTLDFKANALYRDYVIYIDRKSAAGESIYWDDAQVKPEEVAAAVTDPEFLYRLSATAPAGIFPRGFNNVRVVGTKGHAAVPQPIKQLCIILVKAENDGSLYTKTVYVSERIGDYSYSIGSKLYEDIPIVSGIFEADKIFAQYMRQKKPIIMTP